MYPLGLASSGGQDTQCKGYMLTRSHLQGAPDLHQSASPPPPAELDPSLCSVELPKHLATSGTRAMVSGHTDPL